MRFNPVRGRPAPSAPSATEPTVSPIPHSDFRPPHLDVPHSELRTPHLVTLSRNDSKNGLEIRFPDVPASSVREEMKAAGWRWSRFGGCWYRLDTPAHREWANAFLSRQNGTSTPAPLTAAASSVVVPAVADPVAEAVIAQPHPSKIPNSEFRTPHSEVPAWRRRLLATANA